MHHSSVLADLAGSRFLFLCLYSFASVGCKKYVISQHCMFSSVLWLSIAVAPGIAYSHPLGRTKPIEPFRVYIKLV